MKWEIINTEPIVPICLYCDKTTKQMAKMHIARYHGDHGYTHYICSDCALYVKDCMNKWKELKSTNYIPPSHDWRKDYYGTHT